MLLQLTQEREEAMSIIKGFMQYPTRLVNGTVIENEEGGPAFLKSSLMGEITHTKGALKGVSVFVRHTTPYPTRLLGTVTGDRALVPLVTAWALKSIRGSVLVPGPIESREGGAMVLKGLAKFSSDVDMALGEPRDVFYPNLDNISEVINLTPHDITFKRDGMEDIVIESHGVARAEEVFSKEPVEFVDGVPVYSLSYTGKVIGLPDPVPGRMYVVSLITAQCMLALGMARGDVVSPNYDRALGGAASVALHI